MERGVVVVGRDQHGHDIVFVVRRDQRGERRDIDRHAHIIVTVYVAPFAIDPASSLSPVALLVPARTNTVFHFVAWATGGIVGKRV